MTVLSETYDYLQLQNEDIAWKLLRAKNAPVVIAILDAHLGGSNRRLTVQELESFVSVDIDELRLRTDLDLPRSAKAYCDTWREEGYLVRRPLLQTRQETYELSSGTLAAIAFSKRLIQPRRAATQSRLATIVTQINNLAQAMDKNEENRRKVLLEERARIDEKLRELDQGNYQAINSDLALEQAQDIVNLAQEIPRDFVRVRDDFEQLNNSLYATIINNEDGYRSVLEDIFSGVDQIAQSPSGRSFKGFFSLLRDAQLTEIVQDDIDVILESEFARELSSADRQFLRNLLGEFKGQSLEVNSVMTSFAQGLRRFVQNQDYLQDRVLKQLIDKALRRAGLVLEVTQVSTKLNTLLELSSVKLQAVSRYSLMNPFETRAEGALETMSEGLTTMTLEELKEFVRETEVDFSELVNNVNLCLLKTNSDLPNAVSIAQVLEAFPATQGVASIVGLIFLAVEQGRICKEEETVFWLAKQGQKRFARIQRLEFFREVNL